MRRVMDVRLIVVQFSKFIVLSFHQHMRRIMNVLLIVVQFRKYVYNFEPLLAYETRNGCAANCYSILLIYNFEPLSAKDTRNLE